jgi:hypothetical protein
MNRIRTNTLAGFIFLLSLTCSGFTAAECTKAQKRAAVDISLTGLLRILDRSTNKVAGEVATVARSYKANPTADAFTIAFDAIKAIRARHDLSPTVSDLVDTALDIFKSFNPGSVEMMVTSGDEDAARKALEQKFKELEGEVNRLNEEPLVPR